MDLGVLEIGGLPPFGSRDGISEVGQSCSMDAEKLPTALPAAVLSPLARPRVPAGALTRPPSLRITPQPAQAQPEPKPKPTPKRDHP